MSEVILVLIASSNCKEYTMSSDVAEYDKKMFKLTYNIILVSKTVKELGFILDFTTEKFHLIKLPSQ